MGTATYYLKANGCTKEKFEGIKAFFHEGVRAEEFWQNNRDMENQNKRENFWGTFAVHFPIVSKYLDSLGLYDRDCNNDLAGHLDFGYHNAVDEMKCDEYGILWFNAEVWHFAEWDGLCRFLESEYGLENARWISDEYINPYDLL
jgi:hypothetical protein